MSKGFPLSKSDMHCSRSFKSRRAFICFWFIDFIFGVVNVPDTVEGRDDIEEEEEDVEEEVEVEVEYKSSKELKSSSTTKRYRKNIR